MTIGLVKRNDFLFVVAEVLELAEAVVTFSFVMCPKRLLRVGNLVQKVFQKLLKGVVPIVGDLIVRVASEDFEQIVFLHVQVGHGKRKQQAWHDVIVVLFLAVSFQEAVEERLEIVFRFRTTVSAYQISQFSVF